MDFEFSTRELQEIATDIISTAKSLGATDVSVAINESIEASVDILKASVENVETCYSSHLALTTYKNNKRGSVGISGINKNAIKKLVQHAIEIANITEPDPDSTIPDSEELCQKVTPTLELYNPINLSNQDLISYAKELEYLALKADPQITASNGSSVSSAKHNFILANTHGLNHGYTTTRFDTSISLIGGEDVNNMQTDYWYSASRDFSNLQANAEIAKIAVARTVRRLNSGPKIKSGNYPVIFESPVAKSLIGSFLGAINGNSLYRNLSFLTNSLESQIFPEWLNIVEDPLIYKGLASCYFDNEGVKVARHHLLEHGIVKNYQLNCYTAKKLNMKSTGNSGGNHNIIVSSNFAGGIVELAHEINTGLIVIETIGHGLNMVTGDYSVGASGLWVEHGKIQYFVDNLTIAGNLKQMYQNIELIGTDHTHSSIRCGSMLIDGIQVST